MTRRSWIRLGFVIGMLGFFIPGISFFRSSTPDFLETPQEIFPGNQQVNAAMSVSTIPTSTITINEAGMWVTWTHDPFGGELNGGRYSQNVVTGDIWWAEADRVIRWSDTEGMLVIPIADFGYPDESFSAFGTDHEGNIWLGLYTGYFKDERPSGGLLMLALDGTMIDYSDKVEGLLDIMADLTGNRWFFERDYVTYFDGESWNTQKWLGPSGVVVQYYPDVLTTIELGGNNSWYVELPDRVWNFSQSLGEGVSVYNGTDWTTYTVEDGLLHKVVYHMAIDHQGNKWFATAEGVNVLDDNGTLVKDDDTWITYPFDGCHIAVDHEGKVWVVDRSDWYLGVRVWDGQTWTAYDTNNSGLAANEISSIFVDDAGVLWFGTWGGVTRLIQNPTSVFLPMVAFNHQSN